MRREEELGREIEDVELGSCRSQTGCRGGMHFERLLNTCLAILQNSKLFVFDFKGIFFPQQNYLLKYL